MKTKSPKGKFLRGVKEFGLLLLIVFLFNSFVLASFEVPTGSMENTVMTGDFLLVNKFMLGGRTLEVIPYTGIHLPHLRVPGFRDVRRGDVIVFEFPGLRDERQAKEFTYYLKRCVALAGDTVQVINKVLYVNGVRAPLPKSIKFLRPVPLSADRPDPDIFPVGAPFNADNFGPIRVPKKGDVITLARDNIRAWRTFIEREGHDVSVDGNAIHVDGKPETEYTVERNYLFGMGDNRDDSLDSRYWGFVPRTSLVGTPLIVYWSWNPDTPIYRIFEKVASIRWNRIGRLIE
ncbi:MAG: signal peptidase I [Bacteroidota bacterium]